MITSVSRTAAARWFLLLKAFWAFRWGKGTTSSPKQTVWLANRQTDQTEVLHSEHANKFPLKHKTQTDPR